MRQQIAMGWKKWWRYKLALFIAVIAILAPLIAPHDPYAQDLTNRLIEPIWLGGTWKHPFGTDALGRDYLSRIIYGARISLTVGVGAALISGLIGATLGLIGGYFGGRICLLYTSDAADEL